MSSLTSSVARFVVDALNRPSEPGDAVDHAILDAALRCIGLYGIERMTMSDVARDSAVGRATVFRRFQSKDELIRRAFAFELTRIGEDFADAVSVIDDPREQLVELIVEAIRVARTHPIGVRLVQDGTAVAVHRDRQIAAPQLMLLTAHIADCAERVDREVDAAAIAEVLWRFIGSVWLTPDYGLAADDPAAVRRMVHVILSPLTDAPDVRRDPHHSKTTHRSDDGATTV
ncbi:TetR/AcrR family transcriptional regulator [Gordonia sp. zg691]|uniref:TetR/AcrR family transcriptional regulator n=1 Tax=Gordonia jinghuaiqii TaxID=2758710 RepID=UPI0016623BE5|nr:TetR/AcrR family transcriptional regulator [Gordonia jinghuaiqii]MBD0863412.1 TetR/AcrR family transcriptional regulator [Gordonia jinghuaiqii]